MKKLPVIDCDSHIEECEATFAHLDKRYWDRRPLHVDLHGIPQNSTQDSYWLIVVAAKFGRPVSRKKPSDYLKIGSVYVSIEGDEPLVPKALELLGEDAVMASADIPHAEARDSHLDEVSERADLSAAVKEKILSENPARFYGLRL